LNIKLLLTGGTIGIKSTDSILDISEKGTSLKLINEFNAARPDMKVNFSCETLFNELSENMTFSHWKQIYNKIKTISKKDCDGIIITHGTDTLAYTAAFLSLMLKPIEIPVLLVSSNYPIEHEFSNGLCNFVTAVDFIAGVGTNGVFVPFCNGEAPRIHLGSRLLQSQPFTHCFSSLGGVFYGEIENGVFIRNSNKNNPTPNCIEKRNTVSIPHFPDEKTILYLKPYLGANYSVFDFKNKPDAILHGLYHSGTACVTRESKKNSIVDFANRCFEQKIDFYVAPCDSQHPMYSTSKDMKEAGIVFLKDISCVAAYVKLLIAYGSFTDETERQNFICNDIACEHFYR